jgi:ectoine hydroxylase-related dioxygenase (phytanoyl-CoA dioxygenase family)
MNPAPSLLTRDEAERFHRDGYLGPYPLAAAGRIGEILERIDREVLPDKGPNGGNYHQDRHLDHAVIWDLCRDPAIVERAVALYGNDIVLWRSNLFDKPPGAREIGWHQDINFWPIVPDLNLSAWIALTEATVENSCVQLIPGSHRAAVPHRPVTGDKLFPEEADMACVDAGKAVAMELKPGEFFLFTEKLLHFSESNRSGRRRCGLSVRMTVPFVRVEHEKLFPGPRVLMLHGEDRMGFNRVGAPPQK